MQLKDLKLGDMFKFTTSSRTYMLLNQPLHSHDLKRYLENGEAALILSLDDLRVCKDRWTTEVIKVE